MTDDELLALAARAICRVQLNGGDPNQAAMRWNGTECEPQEFPAWRDYRDEATAALAAIKTALIERHRAEVEAIKRCLDEAEIAMPSGTPNWTLAERVKIACIAATDESDRAEVERLTRERDEARTDQAIANNLARSELQKREAAEAALAAAEERIAELEGAASGVFEYFFGTIACRASRNADMEYELLALLRAALAGGTAGDGEHVTQQQRGKP